MIAVTIPGHPELKAEHLVLDYNGTLAIDGILIPGVKEMLNSIAKELNIHVITADTFGSSTENMEGVHCQVVIIKGNDQQMQKLSFIRGLGVNNVIAIGNGLNDALMLKDAVLGIGLIQKEGASLNCLLNADIICTDIIDALELLIYPKRLSATLRT